MVEYLSKCQADIETDYLTSLSDAAVESLSKHQGNQPRWSLKIIIPSARGMILTWISNIPTGTKMGGLSWGQSQE
ncbi:MAG: hypothetical protein CME32_07340 [Gimesia sp.]|nr:hypothetical protein [Gimesia sp.]